MPDLTRKVPHMLNVNVDIERIITQEVSISKKLLDQAEKDCVFFQLDSSDGYLANPPAGKRVFALGTWDQDVGVRIRNELINNINPPIPDEYVLPLYGYKSD